MKDVCQMKHKLKSTMKILQFLFLYLFHVNGYNNPGKEITKSKTPLSYYRSQLERYSDLVGGLPSESDLSQNNLVSFVVHNFNDIFDNYLREVNNVSSISSTISQTVTRTVAIKENKEEDPKLTDLAVKLLYRGYFLNSSNYDEEVADDENANPHNTVLSKYLKSKEKFEQMFTEPQDEISTNTATESTLEINKRSCIYCDNIVTDDCQDPRTKLLPSIICERDTDICYSQHTPFGIIDRGCFNINHNLTTYVCNCNLCNYISISEMPYIFSNKQDWVDNVVELSRTRNLRKSVFKDMACLRCEVNTTKREGTVPDSANCLEGNIGPLPKQVCAENEVCAVIALKSDGYIWRGCVKTPLYNYWLALCDGDLCNYDPLISVHDFI